MSSSWYAHKIAPDGVGEDGCHPDTAQYLREYLRGTLSPSSAAYKITRRVAGAVSASSPPHKVPVASDHFANLWAFLGDASMELETDDMSKIIVLLQAIQEVSEPEATRKASYLWPRLWGFGDMWGDELRKMDWRDLVAVREPIHQADWALERTRSAKAEAMMVVAGVGCIPMGWGLVDICDALESSDAVLDIEIPMIAEWFEIAGSRIFQAVRVGEAVYRTGARRDLWRNDGVVGLERWAFWEGRVGEMLKRGLKERTRGAAERILERMKLAENGRLG